MNAFFTAISVAYIFAIFFWADSPVISQMEVFNPYSLLHVPLYGILTVFLLLALASTEKTNTKSRRTLAAFISAGVGIMDEFHQSFLPQREASTTDVLLDIFGILLVMVLSRWVPPFFWMGRFRKLPGQTP